MLKCSSIIKNLHAQACKLTAVMLVLFGMLAMPTSMVSAQQQGAQQNTQIEDTLCTVINRLTGPVGRGIGAIAVVIVGFSLFLGKVSWGLAIAVSIGIGSIFGAQEIVDVLGGGAGTC